MSGKVTARDRVHIKFCRGDRCMVEREEPGESCKTLDHLLDVTEEQALHQAANRILDLYIDALLQHGPDVGAGLVMAAKETDPYIRKGGKTLIHKTTGAPVADLDTQEG